MYMHHCQCLPHTWLRASAAACWLAAPAAILTSADGLAAWQVVVRVKATGGAVEVVGAGGEGMRNPAGPPS